ncbi:MAG TPA: hypothetical protein VGI12_00865 [Vicinamibacterales bacterium]|jgi:hypothetical protein
MVAILVALLLAPPAAADVIDRIMAVVGAQPITLSEVAAARQFQLVDVPPGTADPRGYALDRLIDRTLMLTEVDRFQPPEPDPAEVTARVDRFRERAGSEAAFAKALAVTGTTADQLRRFVRDSLRMDTYVNQRFGAIIDPAERTRAIAAWAADLRRRAQITVLYHPPQSTRESSR